MREAKPRLLVVDDDKEFLGALSRALSSEYQVIVAASSREAVEQLSRRPDLALLDLRLDVDSPDDRSGLKLLETLRQMFPDLPVVMITAYGDVSTAVECMRLGALDFIQKPLGDIREIRPRLARAIEHSSLVLRVQQLQSDIALIEPREIVGSSAAMVRVKQAIQAAARNGDVTVLIRGETGTGKELVARAIHKSGRRGRGPFTAVSLTALPASMVEAELFGYEAGAFTDARKGHPGYLEQAERGVLFLDEIGETPPNVQTKLLRFLEEREVQRIGATRTIQIDTQVVAATNSNLEAMVSCGEFREDLYFRLRVCEIAVPSLRERREDIPEILEYLIERSRLRGHRVHSIAPAALQLLTTAPWPGNVRQMKNALESAAFSAEMGGHTTIEADDIPVGLDPTRQDRSSVPAQARIGPGFDIGREVARAELGFIAEAFRLSNGKKSEAWRLLNYNDRFALHRRLRSLFRRHPELSSDFPDLAQTGTTTEPQQTKRQGKLC
jgi:DNA-binding NtrC family response regulator